MISDRKAHDESLHETKQGLTEKMPLTTKLWNFLSVPSYDLVKAVESSSLGFACAAWRALHVKESPRRSHMRPSVAVRFFSPFSFTTSSSSVEDSAGWAS